MAFILFFLGSFCSVEHELGWDGFLQEAPGPRLVFLGKVPLRTSSLLAAEKLHGDAPPACRDVPLFGFDWREGFTREGLNLMSECWTEEDAVEEAEGCLKKGTTPPHRA